MLKSGTPTEYLRPPFESPSLAKNRIDHIDFDSGIPLEIGDRSRGVEIGKDQMTTVPDRDRPLRGKIRTPILAYGRDES